MVGRNLVEFYFHVLKNGPRQILTCLESQILKIGPLVQKLQILQVIWEQGNFQDFDTCCNF